MGLSKPFPGLCVAFLLYNRAAGQLFDVRIGNYRIGYGGTPESNLFAYTWDASTNQWRGYKDPHHNGFEANEYHYIYFYFPDKETFQTRFEDADIIEARTSSVLTFYAKYRNQRRDIPS